MAIAASVPDYYMAIIRVNLTFWILPYSKPQTESLHRIQRSSESSTCSVIAALVVKSKHYHKVRSWFIPDQIKYI